MTFQNVLDTFFLPEDQDAFAKAQGWEDAAQMVYYENLSMQEESQQLPPPPAEIIVHELANMDCREVYQNDGDFSEWAAAVYTDDMAGVY